ncbi:hypothetical protein PF008_g25587 [Phytophthora fragariae]|uniref:Uncharacterized protein n=1 Tax=Phytophthora fragariae TaxID=53985 RepID=A0A6G0QJI6_9STRA|nr:hypothetical protein PF008_g25587 [Phytophthora fragariae]
MQCETVHAVSHCVTLSHGVVVEWLCSGDATQNGSSPYKLYQNTSWRNTYVGAELL